jgi:hypothetical protein
MATEQIAGVLLWSEIPYLGNLDRATRAAWEIHPIIKIEAIECNTGKS